LEDEDHRGEVAAEGRPRAAERDAPRGLDAEARDQDPRALAVALDPEVLQRQGAVNDPRVVERVQRFGEPGAPRDEGARGLETSVLLPRHHQARGELLQRAREGA
jgi:hypothetical protein